MRRGYLTPPVLIGLTIICLVVAATLYYNSLLIKNAKNQATSNPSPSAIPNSGSTGSSKETANWKTYENDKAKFSFKYPSTEISLWHENSHPTGFMGLTFISNNFKTTGVGECPYRTTGGSIDIYVKNFNFTKDKDRLTQLVDFEIEYFAKHYPDTQRSKSTIDGLMAQTFTYLGPSDITTCRLAEKEIFKKILTVDKYGTDYTIELRYFSQDKKLQKIFDQMLSTFRFLN